MPPAPQTPPVPSATALPPTAPQDGRDAPLPAPGSMRRDLASAYLATAARIVAWAVVSAIVYRRMGGTAFAVLTLIRSTVGLLAYTTLGLGPAMVKFLADADRPKPVPPLSPSPRRVEAYVPDAPPVLSYADPEQSKAAAPPASEFARVCASGWGLAAYLARGGFFIACVYAGSAQWLHGITDRDASAGNVLAFFMGVGMLLRLLSEPAGAIVHVRGHIALDNVLVAVAEVAWMALVAASVSDDRHTLGNVGMSFAAASLFLLVARLIASGYAAPDIIAMRAKPDPAIMRGLRRFGVAVAIAQAADFLYAPADYILIKALLGTDALAAYAPAVQIDGGLLLIVSGLAGVLLPKAALAHSARDAAAVRAYYVRGTLASLALLSVAAGLVWLLAPALLRLWLGDDLPATRAILPLVLIHTVVGGSGAVGRSILLATGNVKPFTASVLIAGVANVALSYVFVRYLDLGLRGIIYATIVVVVLRGAVWTPWYVLRTLRRGERASGLQVAASPVT